MSKFSFIIMFIISCYHSLIFKTNTFLVKRNTFLVKNSINADSFCIFPPFSLLSNKNTTIILFEQLVYENITTDDGEVPWFSPNN